MQKKFMNKSYKLSHKQHNGVEVYPWNVDFVTYPSTYVTHRTLCLWVITWGVRNVLLHITQASVFSPFDCAATFPIVTCATAFPSGTFTQYASMMPIPLFLILNEVWVRRLMEHTVSIEQPKPQSDFCGDRPHTLHVRFKNGLCEWWVALKKAWPREAIF